VCGYALRKLHLQCCNSFHQHIVCNNKNIEGQQMNTEKFLATSALFFATPLADDAGVPRSERDLSFLTTGPRRKDHTRHERNRNRQRAMRSANAAKSKATSKAGSTEDTRITR
jgi:hypothetical protein